MRVSLRRLAKRTRDATQSRRLLALAEVYDDGSRTDASRIGGVGLQIIRDWVLRFNARGPAPAAGPPASHQVARHRLAPGAGEDRALVLEDL